MNLEYKVLHERFGFSEYGIQTLALNAIGISFASHEEKDQ
jgi:adenosine deaminase